jgi:predicted TIM-barrel fold metal-dependent hydrolase
VLPGGTPRAIVVTISRQRSGGLVPERLISVDSHVFTTHAEIKSHLPQPWHDEYDEGVAKFAVLDGEQRGGVPMKLPTRAMEQAALERPGYRDPKDRLSDMDTDGIDVEVLYSEVSGFRNIALMTKGREEAARAFNDAMAEFASADPRRLMVSYQIPLWDIDSAVSEVLRLAGEGARSVHLPNYPSEFGLPDYHDTRYDPLWGVLSETGLPISQHLGIKESLWDVFRRDPTPSKGIFTSLPALALAENLAFWILAGTLARFPKLRILLVEAGLGWMNWYLSVLDQQVELGYEYPAIQELPSFYFHRQVFLSFMDDAPGLQMRHDLGLENLMWSTDYPHPATTFPRSRERIDQQMEGIPAGERELLVCGNAARVYGI